VRLRYTVAVMAAIGGARMTEAVACPGGGGGGSRGGGGGGAGSSGGGFVNPARSEPACEDASDVVGYRHCTPYGAWGTGQALPHIIIEAGVIVRRFGSLLDRQTGSVTHGGEAFAFRVMQPPGSRQVDTAVLSTMRAGVGLPHGLYTALEVDLGGLAQPGHAATEMMSSGVFGSPELQQDRGFLVDTIGAVGVHGATRFGGLGVELTGGVRYASYSFHSNYHDCEQATSVVALAPVAEARARGELWLNPWLTAGVTVGSSVIENHTWMGGVYLGVHSRTFGGDR